MCIWDGWPSQPEGEREDAWVDPLDGRLPGETEADQEERADGWKYPGWPEDDAGPEYWLNKR